ncbi:MAG: hypothetical protein RR555_00200 [Bacteroidales bacterium]
MGITSLKAQYYLTGEDPARVKWNKIRGANYTMIYPQEIDSLARKYLWLLEENRRRVLAGLNINPKSIPVILHPYTVRSNGMVVWAPKRMELYTQPDAGAYPQMWSKQLVLHELRHVGQVSHFTKGIYKVGYALLGEQITGLGVGVYPSTWMMEGDAVVAETELSNTGRGREVSFLDYYRASFLEGDYRNWDRWRYGSYKYYTPDIYAFGYLINSTIRYKTGKYGYAGQVLDYYVKRFYNPNVTSANYRKNTGAKRPAFLNMGIRFLDSMWRAELIQRGELTSSKHLTSKVSKYNTDYNEAVALSEDRVIYVKSSYDKPASLVMLNVKTGSEKRLRSFSGSAAGGQLSPHGNKIYFTETVSSPRWKNESFNRLFAYDLTTNKIKKLSRRTSYNNPFFSSTGDSLAVVEYKVGGTSNIAVLNASTGEKQYSIAPPLNGQITEGAWIGDTIYAFAITSRGLGFFRINAHGGEWEKIIQEQNMKFSGVHVEGDTIYFSSGIDGVANIYMYNTGNGDFKRLTNNRLGAYSPSIAGRKLFFSEIGRGGFSPAVTDMPCADIAAGYKVELKEGQLKSDSRFVVAEELSRQAHEALQQKGISYHSTEAAPVGDSLKAKRYNKFAHLFRFHSWLPVYLNVDKILTDSYDKIYENVAVGASLFSQNSLGTAVTMLGYSYKKGLHAGHANFTYMGLYPVFDLSVDVNADDRYQLKMVQQGKDRVLQRSFCKSALFETRLRAYIPFNFSSHGWVRGLTPQMQWDFSNNEVYSYQAGKFQYRHQVVGGLQYYQMRPVAVGAVFPEWGFSAVVKGAFEPGGGENFGKVGSVYAYGYVPGIWDRQGIRLSVSYQKQFINGKLFYLDNLVDMPRGYDDDVYGTNYFKATIDYAIPVWTGDKSLGWLAYLKRLQVVPYADFATVDKKNLYTYGADVMLEGYFFHIGAPVGIGVRYGRLGGFQGSKNVFNLLFTVSIY